VCSSALRNSSCTDSYSLAAAEERTRGQDGGHTAAADPATQLQHQPDASHPRAEGRLPFCSRRDCAALPQEGESVLASIFNF
jgi:hypothetical protein